MEEENKKINQIDDEDKALISAFVNEQAKEAVDRLVIKYQDKVFNLCYRFMGNYHDANDCAQETFVRVYRSLANFKGKASFSTWLYRVAVNTCKNKLASLTYRVSKMFVRLDRPKGAGDEKQIEVRDESRSPEVVFAQSEKSKQIQKAIDGLPRAQKTVVVLRDIEGLPYEEIAQITGYNIGTVKSKLARARKILREKLTRLI
jgi:RNA polymerase sigma-70 factor (ECF subfamily)